MVADDELRKACEVNGGELIFKRAWSSPLHVVEVRSPRHPSLEMLGMVVVDGFRWSTEGRHWSPRATIMTVEGDDLFYVWADPDTRKLYGLTG